MFEQRRACAEWVCVCAWESTSFYLWRLEEKGARACYRIQLDCFLCYCCCLRTVGGSWIWSRKPSQACYRVLPISVVCCRLGSGIWLLSLVVCWRSPCLCCCHLPTSPVVKCSEKALCWRKVQSQRRRTVWVILRPDSLFSVVGQCESVVSCC